MLFNRYFSIFLLGSEVQHYHTFLFSLELLKLMTTATLNQLFYKRVKIFLWTLKKSLVIKNTNISKKIKKEINIEFNNYFNYTF